MFSWVCRARPHTLFTPEPRTTGATPPGQEAPRWGHAVALQASAWTEPTPLPLTFPWLKQVTQPPWGWSHELPAGRGSGTPTTHNPAPHVHPRWGSEAQSHEVTQLRWQRPGGTPSALLNCPVRVRAQGCGDTDLSYARTPRLPHGHSEPSLPFRMTREGAGLLAGGLGDWGGS